HPGPSPDGAFFAYATTEFGPRLQIAVRETFDASPLQITANSGDNLFPRVSPDGKLIAYASNREGNWDLFVTRIDSPGSVTQVTFDPENEIAPSWSPDGRKLVYSSGSESGVWQIVIVDVATRIKTYLGAGIYPDWSPDAKNPMICFQSQPRTPGGRSGVWCVKPDGTGLRELVGDKAKSWSAINPHFSPDGRWIAYATVNKSVESRKFGDPNEADDIWIVRNDGAYTMRLTDDLSAEWWPAWGGDRVFFVSNRGGMQNICSVRVKPLEDSK
ncbi:MAG: PD40 domain-containing protein, partial [Planctomycetes bacterium]|nr:PD40 domain-containing protein [Planctomycetota bacterium]